MEDLSVREKKNKDAEELTINPKTRMLVSEGIEYADTPRMRALIKRANFIRNNFPY